MRMVAVIDQREVVEKILRHLDLWSGTPLLTPARAPLNAGAGPWTREPFDDVDPCLSTASRGQETRRRQARLRKRPH